MLRDILKGGDPQVLASIQVLKAADADVVVLGGFDFDLNLMALRAFAKRVGGYPHQFALPSNRGLLTGQDLNADGKVSLPDDAVGYAAFAGQGGLAILSRWPIDLGAVQDLSNTRWLDLAGNIAPEGTDPEQLLSTTAHWIVPMSTPSWPTVQIMVWHATPPVFDGPEDRNGRRNHDEAFVWQGILDGRISGPFILTGLANLDPADGDGRPEALNALLTDPRITDPKPKSEMGVVTSSRDGGKNLFQNGDPALDTADWSDDGRGPGNLRVSYLLPSVDLTVVGSGVLWPDPETSLGRDVAKASRHRLIWVDLGCDGCGDGR